MPENDAFWDFYWEIRLKDMENLGKRDAILAASRLVRDLYNLNQRPLRVLELGCGEGQVIGSLVDTHSQICDNQGVVGVDINPASLACCRRNYPQLNFIEGDLTDPRLYPGLGKVDVILLVNVLHEIFSACFSPILGEVDIAAGKKKVEQTLAFAVDCLAPGGFLVLFDGVEPSADPNERVTIRLLDLPGELTDLETFVREYRPFRISYRKTSQDGCIELSRRDFVRFIDKSIFLGKPLWEIERTESYQYFSKEEFQAVLTRQSLEISTLRTFTINEEKWRNRVEIVTPGVNFPEEHILILAHQQNPPVD